MATAIREGHWKGRPLLSGLIRALVIGVPVFAGWLAARTVAALTSSWTAPWVRVAVVLLAAVLVSVLVSRLTSRLLPLAVLLRMTMLFPDRAPSRMKVARRTTSLAEIKARLVSTRLDEQEAAATMLALVTALGRHDRHTRGHSERVRLFCDLLATELGLSAAEAGRLRWAALIHDIGKLEVPEAVLNKPGKLDGREWDMIRCHPFAGARLAAPLKDWLGPWYAGIPEHHEKYDGSGYPCGLSATAISTAGRAIAVVDAFETMTAARSYKSARSTLRAREELTRCAGSHFDPVMVRAFLAISLPRLLWSVGPLAFAVNLPYLQAAAQSGVRFGNVVGTTTATATNVAAATTVAMAVSVAPAVTAPAVAEGPPAAYGATQHSQPRPSSDASHDSSRPASPRPADVRRPTRPSPAVSHPVAPPAAKTQSHQDTPTTERKPTKDPKRGRSGKPAKPAKAKDPKATKAVKAKDPKAKGHRLTRTDRHH